MCISTYSRYGNYNRALAHAIESQVIAWTNLMEKILMEDSLDLFKTDCNPVPSKELRFWSSRKCNLQNIYNQVTSPFLLVFYLLDEFIFVP